MTSDVDNMHLSDIHICSLAKWLFKTSIFLEIGLFSWYSKFFIYFECKSFLTCFANIFFPNLWLLSFFKSVFWKAEVFHFDEVQFIHFSYMDHTKNSLSNSRWQKKKKTPLPCFLLDLHLGFTFRSKIHFKLIINMMWCIGWDSFFCTWMFNYSFAHFVEGLFLSLNCYGTFAKNQLTTYIWVLSVLCCSTVCSVCLSFHQYHCLDYSRFIVSFESVSVIFVIFKSFLLYA